MFQKNQSRQGAPTTLPEFVSIKRAAALVGVHYRILLEQVADGAIPHYKLGRSRKLLRISEVVSSMQVNGGQSNE